MKRERRSRRSASFLGVLADSMSRVQGSTMVGWTIFMMSMGRCSGAEGVAFVLSMSAGRGCRRCRVRLWTSFPWRPGGGGRVRCRRVEGELGGLFKEAAVEVADAFETAGGGAGGLVHGVEEAAEEVVGVFGGFDVGEEVGEEVAREEVDVLGEEGDEHLEDEALGERARDLADVGHVAEDGGEAVGGVAGDFDAVVAEDGAPCGGRGRRGDRNAAGVRRG